MIENNIACVFAAPGRRQIRRDNRVTVIRPNPFIGYQKRARKKDFPRYTIVVHFIGFFVQCPIMLQKNEGLLKETTESAQTP